MSESAIERATTEGVFLAVLGHLNNKHIREAIDCFADDFTFKDHGRDWNSRKKAARSVLREDAGTLPGPLCTA
jgi:hypothetical protein